MKKSIASVIALSAALPLAALADSDVGGHAHAGATDHHTMHDQLSDKPWEFYGALYMGLQANYAGDEPNDDGDEAQRNLWLTSDGTTVGFRGAIPLDAGLKAVWQIESTINLDEFATEEAGGGGHAIVQPPNHNDSMLAAGHNSFLGLSGEFGTVLAGKHNTPFFDATIQFDLFHHLPGDIRAVLGTIPGTESGTGDHHASTFNASASDMIMYKSPKMSGFSFEAAIFGLNETLEETDDKSSAYGLGARYEHEMFTLVGAWEQHKNYDSSEDNAVLDTTSGLVLGGMLHMNDNNTMIGAFFEQLSADDPEFSDESRNGYYVNLQQRILSKSKVKFAYAMADEYEGEDGAQNFAVGFFQELGAGTEAYVLYTTTDNDAEAAYSNAAIGPLEHGGDPDTFAVGLVHMF